jgi:nicotinate phosphoribosyltransferase
MVGRAEPALDLKDRRFWIAREEEILEAETTDIYFHYTKKVLEARNVNPTVVMEVYTRSLPYPEGWGVVAGIYEVAKLLEGRPIDVYAMEEGEVFLTNRSSVVYEPVLQLIAPYREIAPLENPILGFLCTASGIATKAARMRMVAGDRLLLSFGTRRVHPALAPTIERATYIGGFDRVSNVLGARLMDTKPVGTMPHALIQCLGDPAEAWRAFDEALPEDIPRIALVDTYADEKTEAIKALETLGDRLYGVRLDTPGSRRGDWRKIVEEVRWELNLRGGQKVKIFASGGVDEEQIRELRDLVDGFGVGTRVASAPVIDFNLKVVEVIYDGERHFRAKRGDISGRKQVYRDEAVMHDLVLPYGHPAPEGRVPLLRELIKGGELVRRFLPLEEIRARVIARLERLKRTEPKLEWRA